MIKLLHSSTGNIFYATKESAGFDICASEEKEIQPGSWEVIGTGLRIMESSPPQPLPGLTQELPCVFVIQIRPRSGLAAKFGITVLNAPSTIDSDYRGEIKVNLINHGKEPFKIQPGERIAQGVCTLAFHLPSIPVQMVERGEKGFGSTGSK